MKMTFLWGILILGITNGWARDCNGSSTQPCMLYNDEGSCTSNHVDIDTKGSYNCVWNNDTKACLAGLKCIPQNQRGSK